MKVNQKIEYTKSLYQLSSKSKFHLRILQKINKIEENLRETFLFRVNSFSLSLRSTPEKANKYEENYTKTAARGLSHKITNKTLAYLSDIQFTCVKVIILWNSSIVIV